MSASGPVIPVTCVYCGRKLTAKDEWAGRHAKCPGCGHRLFVRPKEAAKEPEADDAALDERLKESWAQKSDAEIAELLVSPEQRQRRGISRLFAEYDDLTLFTLSVTFGLMLIANAPAREDLLRGLLHIPDSRLQFLAVCALLGMVFSFLNVFFPHNKRDFEKCMMVLFAVGVTAGTGIYFGWIMLQAGPKWLIVFLLWNIVNGAILLLALRAGAIGPDSITDEPTTRGEVLISLLSVSLLLLVCNRLIGLHWATTYSICVCYTMGLQQAIRCLAGATRAKDRHL